MKKLLAALLALSMLLTLAACAKTTDTTPSDAAQTAASDSAEPTTLTYGSADYTRINPAMDEHGEINLLLFDGLTAHDGENNVVPGPCRDVGAGRGDEHLHVPSPRKPHVARRRTGHGKRRKIHD